MDYRSTIIERNSRASNRDRDVPSFIEPRPPSILNPFMRPRPQKGTNLLELFEEDSIEEEAPELVQVYLRLKPSNVRSSLYEVRSDQCLITSVDTATAGHGRRTQHNVSKMYTFSHIFGPDANQKELFEHVVKGNLRKLPDGHNFTLLTYGASGSGKTYTLMGTVKAPGLVPRALEYVFKVVDAAQYPLYHPGENGATKLSVSEQEHELHWVQHLRQVSAPLRDKYRRMSSRLGDLTKSTLDLSARTKHYVWVSFVEIYNEAIYDLLSTAERTAASKLRIREDSNGNAFVKGATQAFVRTGEEAYDVLVAGKHNLQVHATGVHAQSSRSHCIFTITMLTETEGGVRSSHVRLCDLAGSERARRTRNTGARMQESRAINTSLHVLERCLHTLRRRARALVPYRESKLTRLLGAGLSGARGEAVSMVVTLNPAPEFAFETRHVLQLAAVARDIQVNNTIAESISTLDSSAADTTAVGAELVTLRADNERLHYELMQAQTLNAKLLTDMACKQEENALTVKELVDEARDIEQQYYTAQIRSLEERHSVEIAELREEYEARLNKKSGHTEEGTPSRALQKKILLLMKQIAILEEELSAEKLAKARMDEELQHLRACIEERDEKASGDNSNEDAIQLTDSEGDTDEEDDLCNESLEPTFKKENLNRSRLMRQSSLLNNTHDTTYDSMFKIEHLKNDSVVIKEELSAIDTRDSTSTVEDNDINDTLGRTDETYDVSNNDSCDRSMDCPDTVKKVHRNDKSTDMSIGRFSVEAKDESKHSVRETYFVRESKVSVNENDDSLKKNDTVQSDDTGINVSGRDANDSALKDTSDDEYKLNKPIMTQVDKIKQLAKTTASSDSSLTQFELLEQEANDYEDMEKKTYKYFEEGNGHVGDIVSPRKIKEKKQYFDNIEPCAKVDRIKDLLKKHDVLRSPSIVHEDIPEGYEPTTINKIMRESFTKISDVAPAYDKSKVLLKKHESLDLFEESPCPKLEILKTLEAKNSVENIAVIGKQDETEVPTEAIEKETDTIKIAAEVDTLQSVEAARKSIENIALVDKVGEIEAPAESIENETEGDVGGDGITDENEKELTGPNNTTNNFKKSVSKNYIDVNAHVEMASVCNDNQAKDKEKLNVSSHIVNAPEMENHQIKIELNIKTEIITDEEPPAKELTKAIKIKQERISTATVSVNEQKELNSDDVRISQLSNTTNQPSSQENTIDAFEDIYKDVTMPRATDFELLVSEKSNATANLSKTEELDSKTDKEAEDAKAAGKYNLRTKTKGKDELEDELLVENTSKSAPKTVKKSLRLRRQKTRVDEEVQLKDIVNLQKEFSDVTLDVPAPLKITKDIPSPGKSETENVPPLMGVQSCPSKSVTRSRRKLFTPRPEPLEESPAAGASAERVRVPRPSYHRPRTRRRLN